MEQIFIWTLTDVIGAAVVAITVVGWLAGTTVSTVQKWRCKHDGGVNETGACDAICRKCGKNLGFIGNWRKNHGEAS